jgi:DNA-binding NtrC family response regulator
MGHRILIVEDNPVDLRLFEQALASPAREIESCTDGRSALAAFQKRPADVVVSDIVMPNMEGTELLKELTRRAPGLPVILITRYGSIAAAVAAMRSGAFDYVSKPVEVFELQTRVARA